MLIRLLLISGGSAMALALAVAVTFAALVATLWGLEKPNITFAFIWDVTVETQLV
jgi:hypothetical protein